ncbi:hypothetical protein [Marinobacter sp.]|uniref:hypothetical protein n=1 Tax=Marinobacter sp. TaxID=50741 RepID=UPI003A8FFB5E
MPNTQPPAHSLPAHSWHLSKAVTVGNLIAVWALVFSGLWYLAGERSRVDGLQLTVEHLKESRLQDQARNEKRFDEIRATMQRIDNKLDQLIMARARD